MDPRQASANLTRPLTARAGLIALLVSFLWSGNIVSIKFGLVAIPPFWSAFWRMLLGSVVVAAWSILRNDQLLPARGEGRPFLVLGILFTAQIALFNLAVFYTSPAYAVILLNTNPVFVNLISHRYVPNDRITPRRLLGLAVAFGGIVHVLQGQPEPGLAPDPALGNAFMLASSLLLASRIVYTQRLVNRTGPLRPVVWQMVASLPLFLGVAAVLEEPLVQPLTAGPVVAMLYQAVVVAGFCFVVWTSLLQHYSAGDLAMYGFTVPVFGVLLSAALFGERITIRLAVGAAAVAAGIAIVTGSRGNAGRRGR